MKGRRVLFGIGALVLFVGGFVAGAVYVGEMYCTTGGCAPGPEFCRESLTGQRSLTWTTPGIWGDRGDRLPRGATGLAFNGTDLWDAFDATPVWRRLSWEDDLGQSIRVFPLSGGVYISITLGEDQGRFLEAFLAVLYPQGSASDVEALADYLWDTADNSRSVVGGHEYKSRGGHLEEAPDAVAALAHLDLRLQPAEVGTWSAVGSGYTIEMHVATDTVHLGGHDLTIDAGGRVAGGEGRITKDHSLHEAAFLMQAVTGLEIQEPRLRTVVDCSDYSADQFI